jgi:hypothetical protein
LDANQRLDYFRSELEGKLAAVRQEMLELGKLFNARVAALEKNQETVVRELNRLRLER